MTIINDTVTVDASDIIMLSPRASKAVSLVAQQYGMSAAQRLSEAFTIMIAGDLNQIVDVQAKQVRDKLAASDPETQEAILAAVAAIVPAKP